MWILCSMVCSACGQPSAVALQRNCACMLNTGRDWSFKPSLVLSAHLMHNSIMLK
jgi:hypothetical protein